MPTYMGKANDPLKDLVSFFFCYIFNIEINIINKTKIMTMFSKTLFKVVFFRIISTTFLIGGGRHFSNYNTPKNNYTLVYNK